MLNLNMVFIVGILPAEVKVVFNEDDSCSSSSTRPVKKLSDSLSLETSLDNF